MTNYVEIRESLMRTMLEDAIKAIDASIEKIKMKLDNGVDWNLEDKINTYKSVYNLFSERRPFVVSNYMLNSLYDKYESVLEERIFEKVIPSLENKHGKLLLSQIVEQYFSEQEEYTKNLVMIFQRVENIGCLLRVKRRPLSLILISKKCFCHLVWENFHNEIDEALTDWIDSGAFSEEKPADGGDIIDQEESNILKRKATEFFNVMKNIEDKRLQTSFDILRSKKIMPQN